MSSPDPAGRIVNDAYNRKRREVIAKTKVLVFGPGQGKENPGFLEREAVRDMLEENGCRAHYPESILNGGNAVFGESVLIGEYNLVYILLMGLGPSVEFSHFIQRELVAQKVRIFQEAKYKMTTSFLNEVLEPFCALYRQCYNFDDRNSLVSAARECFEAYVAFVLIIGLRPY